MLAVWSSFSLGILRQIESLVSKDPYLAKLTVFADEGLAICRLINLFAVSSVLYWVSFWMVHLSAILTWNSKVGQTGWMNASSLPIFCCLPWAGSQWQQAKQCSPDIPHPSNILQLLWVVGGVPEAFSNQMRFIISSVFWLFPRFSHQLDVPGKPLRRHPWSDMQKQQLPPDVWAPCPVSQAEPNHHTEETHCRRLYLQSHSFNHYPKLMTQDAFFLKHHNSTTNIPSTDLLFLLKGFVALKLILILLAWSNQNFKTEAKAN